MQGAAPARCAAVCAAIARAAAHARAAAAAVAADGAAPTDHARVLHAGQRERRQL